MTLIANDDNRCRVYHIVSSSARDGHLIELRVIANADAPKGLLLHFRVGLYPALKNTHGSNA